MPLLAVHAGSAPGIPTNVQATPDDQSFTLTWTAPTGANSYRIEYDLNAQSGFRLVTTSTTTSKTITRLQGERLVNGTTYKARVQGCANTNPQVPPAQLNCGAWAATVTVVPAAPTPPSVPQNVAVTAGDAQFTLT